MNFAEGRIMYNLIIKRLMDLRLIAVSVYLDAVQLDVWVVNELAIGNINGKPFLNHKIIWTTQGGNLSVVCLIYLRIWHYILRFVSLRYYHFAQLDRPHKQWCRCSPYSGHHTLLHNHLSIQLAIPALIRAITAPRWQNPPFFAPPYRTVTIHSPVHRTASGGKWIPSTQIVPY